VKGIPQLPRRRQVRLRRPDQVVVPQGRTEPVAAIAKPGAEMLGRAQAVPGLAPDCVAGIGQLDGQPFAEQRRPAPDELFGACHHE
jgi:hypothetical protein